MIDKIIEISNYATFNSLKFTNGNNSDWDGKFKKNTVIYAPNGTGKTSLSLIFQSIKEDDSSIINKKKKISNDLSPKISLLSDDNQIIEFDNGTWNKNDDLDIEIFNSFYFEKNVYTFNLDDFFNDFILENDSELREQVKTLSQKEKQLFKLRKKARRNRYLIKLAEEDEQKATEVASSLNISTNFKVMKKKNQQISKRVNKLSIELNNLYKSFENNFSTVSEIFGKYCTEINGILSSFNDKIIINEIKPIYKKEKGRLSPTLIYSLSIDGKNTTLQGRNEISFNYYLSDGDKSAISFASFIAKINIMENFEEKIIIIDDPFTSFDSGRKQRTIDLLVRLSSKVSQLILLTHDIEFGEKFSNRIYPKNDLLTLQMFRQRNSTNIKTIDFSRELLMGLIKNISLLHDFNESGASNETELVNVFNAIRLSLEGIFKIKFFEFNSPNIWLGTYVDYIEKSAIEENYEKFSRLTPYLQKLRELVNYSNSAHHDESIYGSRNIINESELKSYVKEALEVIDII
ncbi:AAA family ATPase [bacterium]|nr:AAA family ATPase [bacterium]